MRALIHIFCIAPLAGSAVLAQEAEPVKLRKTEPLPHERAVRGETWLGLGVSKPDDVTVTHVPALPPGIGFVVSELAAGGPAEKAGMLKNDLLWKMGEQMLVNEGQLATLLRLASPGDEVTVSVFREGKSIDLKVILGEAKDADRRLIRRMAENVMRSEDGAMRIVDLEGKKAVVSDERGTAEVTRLSTGDSLRIVDTAGKVVYEGMLSDRPELSTVPDGWRRQVCAMRRGLDHSESAAPVPMRQPRPRIVPIPMEESPPAPDK